MRILKLIFLLSFIFSNVHGQTKYTLSGYIRDASNGESLPGATVSVASTKMGMTANAYGFYSLSMPSGTYEIKVSYLGYVSKSITVNLDASKKVDIELDPKKVEQKEVIIKAKSPDANIKGTEMGMHQLNISDVKKLPVILGEVDIMKSLTLLPGVSSAGEAQSGFYVRGGGPDQNLVLLDDAVVYNSGHLFGFFSVFNADAVKNVNLIKGGMPANFGGRLSSVIDVRMREGNDKQFQVDGGVGLIASRLSIQGPIIKNKASFIISARRTYIDALVKPFVNKESAFAGSGYYFYDLNTKVNYKISEKDRLYLSGYFGRDVFSFSNSGNSFKFSVPWGNATGTLRWNHQINDKMFMNTTAVYNDYNFEFSGEQQAFKVRLYSGIRDIGAKSDIDYYSKFNHNFKLGTAYTYHTFTPSTVAGESAGVAFNPNQANKKYGHEVAAYLLDEFNIGKSIKVNTGIRYSTFMQVGPYTNYTFDPIIKTKKIDSIVYQNGELVKSYGGWEPRLNARVIVDSHSSFKMGITRNLQYVHLVTNNGSTLPTDFWTPSSYYVRPQIGWQYSAGYFRNFFNDGLETSVEVYYKNMKNLIEYREGYTPDQLRDVDYDFVFGTGKAYGMELFVNKTKGRWNGWLSYTLSWTKRHFALLNDNQDYYSKYDQRHNLSITSTYELNKKWTLSALFVFGSGTRVTIPVDLYVVDQTLLQGYKNLNNFVLPPYHRFDIGAVYTPIPKKVRRWESSWTMGIYNVYSRQNPYFLYLDTSGDLSNGIQLKVMQVSIFPIVPSITYNFKFK